MTAPLLRVEDARIDAAGSVLLEALTVTLDGSVVGLVGSAWSVLFRLLSRQATLTKGTVEILGIDATTAVPSNHVGIALAEATLPRDLRAVQVLEASARLAGLGYFASKNAATSTLARLGMASLAKQKISSFNETERRALIIAQAIISDPAVLAVETPLAGLDATAAASIRALMDRARDGRRLLVSSDEGAAVGPEADFVLGMDAVAVLAGSTLAAAGPPKDVLSPASRYVIWTTRAATHLATALAARGLTAELDLAGDDPHGAGRLVVALGPEGTDAIVDASLEVSAPIVELLPFGIRARDPAAAREATAASGLEPAVHSGPAPLTRPEGSSNRS